HDGRFGAGPGVEEARLEGASAHAVVPGAVGRGGDERQVGDLGVGDGVDHHRAVFDDPATLVLRADHVAGGVVHEQQGRVVPVGQLDELGGLLRFLGEQDAPRVGEDPHRVAEDLGPAGHQARAVHRLELVEVAAVDDPRDDLPRIGRDPQVVGDDPEQLIAAVEGLDHVGAGGPALLGPAYATDDAAGPACGVMFVYGEWIGGPGHARVRVGPAERLLVGELPGVGLDQGRAGEEHLGSVLDHHHVVAHAGNVGTAGGRVAVDHGDRGDARLGQPREIAEQSTAGD